MPAAPRTDPYLKNYLIRLLRWVKRSRCLAPLPIVDDDVLECTYFGSVSETQTCPPSLPFGDLLSSTDSVTAVAALFARFVGTTKSSDFPPAFMSAVPSERFSDRPRDRPEANPRNRWDLPVLAFGMSTHAQGLRLRRVRSHLACSGALDVAFSLTLQDRHTGVVMSELNGWPALPFARTLKTDRSPDPPLR